MKQFAEPDITVIRIETEDILTASGGQGSFEDDWNNPNELPKV